MAERPVQVHGGKDIKSQTVDKSRLTAAGETLGYVLKVQLDGSLDYEPVLANLNDIVDVEVPSPNHGDRIMFNTGTNNWENKQMIYDSDIRAYLLEQ